MATDNVLEIKNLHTYFYTDGGVIKAVDGVDVELRRGATLGIVGESGSGKSVTSLSVMGLLAGTKGKIADGEILLDGDDIVKLTKEQQRKLRGSKISMIFQEPMTSLNPVMKIGDQVAECVLQHEKISKKEALKKAEDMLRKTGVPRVEHMMKEYPFQLSGGQRQRVAMGRAIVRSPKVFLMDEPLSNLDAKLRVDMRSELKRLHTETGTTMIYVTHDQVEALTMSTKIAIFREGIIIQVAHPLELYNNPANLYVADFIGNPRINFVDGKAEVSASGLTVNSVLGRMTFPVDHLKDENMPREASFDAVLGIRPEQIAINTSRQSPSDIEAHIYTSMPAGSETLVTVKVGGVSMVIKALGITHYNPDQVVYLSIDTTKINVFDKKTENLIKYSVE